MAKKPSFESLKGFREFYPDEMAARRQVFDTAERVVRTFGYREVNGPSVEPLDLFRVKSGDEVVEQTYSFTDKGGREVTLIPELTPTVARMVAARAKTMPKPMKWYSWGKMWRYEQPQSGRLREFYQLNVDCFGSSRPEADAEILAVGAEIMLALGLDGEFEFKVNSRQYMNGLLASDIFGIASEKIPAVFTVIDKMHKISEYDFKAQLSSLGIKNKALEILIPALGDVTTFSKLLDFIDKGAEPYGEMTTRLAEVATLLDGYGLAKYFCLDRSVVRGLAYYTDLVFECFDRKGELRSLFGGGRYDGVVELFDGPPTPAVGFAMGDAVLEVLMRRSEKWPERQQETDYYLVWVGEAQRAECLKIARKLREQDKIVETDVMGKDVSKQMSYANYIGAKKVLLLGDEEKRKNMLMVRDMETGQQFQEPLDKYMNPEGDEGGLT